MLCPIGAPTLDLMLEEQPRLVVRVGERNEQKIHPVRPASGGEAELGKEGDRWPPSVWKAAAACMIFRFAISAAGLVTTTLRRAPAQRTSCRP